MIKNKFLCSLLCSTVVSLSFATEIPYKSTKSHRNSEYISINEKRYVREINRHSDMTFRIDAKKKTCVIDAASFTNTEIHSISIVSYNPKLKVIIKGKFKEHINDVTFSPQIYFQIRPLAKVA